MPIINSFISKLFSKHSLFIIVLALVFLGINIYNTVTVPLTNDEIAHIAAAQSYTQGQGLNSEHPTLLKSLNGLMIQIFDGEYKRDDGSFLHRGQDYIYRDQDATEKVTFISRIVYVLFSLLIFVWVWIYTFVFKFFDKNFSFIFLLVWAGSPSIFSHSYLATFDVASSIGVVISLISASYIIYNFKKLTGTSLALHSGILAIALSIAINVKFTSLLLLAFLGGFWSLAFVLVFLWSFLQNKFTPVKRILVLFLINFLTMASSVYILNSYSHRNAVFGLTNLPLIIKPFVETLISFFGGFVSPFVWYVLGLFATLSRSDNLHENFVDDKLVLINFGQLWTRVVLFKESEVFLIFTVISSIFLILYSISQRNKIILQIKQIFKSIKETLSNLKSFGTTTKSLDQLKQIYDKIWFRKILVFGLFFSFALIYIYLSFDKSLTIGYRHSYPFMGVIWFMASWLIFKAYQIVSLKITKFRLVFNFGVSLVLMVYAFLTLRAVPENITFVNQFWQKPKYQLANDSTIYWGQHEKNALQFILNQGVSPESSQEVVAFTWNTTHGGPTPFKQNLMDLAGKKNDNFANEVVLNQVLIKDIKNKNSKYLIVDIYAKQFIVNASNESQIASKNLTWLEQNTPVYQLNEVIWVYELV